MDERTKKAFDFAADSTKQLIALSTGILALTITFAKDILAGVDITQRWILGAAWVAYLISIIFGVATLLALTGTLQPQNASQVPNPSIREKSITNMSKFQVLTFILATLFVVVFSIIGLTPGVATKPTGSTRTTMTSNGTMSTSQPSASPTTRPSTGNVASPGSPP